MSRNRVYIVGGGWAGLAAATKLAGNGLDVTLVEQSDHLGGRCASFWDEDFKEWLDIGTHAFLGAYEQSFDLLRTWGVDYQSHMNFISDIEWRGPNGQVLNLKLSVDDDSTKSPKRKALESMAAMMSFKGMSFRDRLKTAKVLKSLINFRFDKFKAEPTIAKYLEKFGIRRNDCGGLWVALTQAVFNGQPEIIGLYPLVNAINEGLMIGGSAAKIGVVKTSFKQLMTDPAEKYLNDIGVEIVYSSRVKEIILDSNAEISGIQTEKKRYNSKYIVIAVPPKALMKLLPLEIASSEFFHRFTKFETAPIATVHINAKSSVINSNVVLIPKLFTQWLFSRGAKSESGYSSFSAVISDAPRKNDMSLEDIEKTVLRDIDKIMGSKINSDSTVVKTVRYPEATVQLKPESKKLRPQPKTPIDGLFLAGDWCDTGLPATIESAVRSGNHAAEELLKLC